MTIRALAVIVFFMIFSMPIAAEETDNQKYTNAIADTSKVVDLDEVIVITQPKESFRLRWQPLSSSMYSASDLAVTGSHDLRELSAFVPGFTMPNYGSRYTSSVYIRGIGSRVNSPAVGIYVDGIPVMSKSAFNQHYYGIDRVDVLRGPQSTLYGLNTEGGMIRVYTRNPMSYQGTDITISGGSRGYRNIEASHYNKVSERFAFSLAGFYDGQNGFFRNQTTGQRADEMNEAGGRIRLMWRPTERLSFDAFADYQYVDQNGFPYGQLDLTTGKAASPSSTYQGTYRRNTLLTGLNATYSTEKVDFSYSASYQWLNDYMMMDQDYMPADYMHLRQWQMQNSMTHELAVKSRRPVGGFWHYAMGAFFSSQWLRTGGPVYFDKDMTDLMYSMLQPMIEPTMYNAILQAFTQRMIAQGTPESIAARAAAAAIEQAGGVHVTGVSMGAPGIYRTPLQNFGLYHESNFDITPSLTATLGLRYDWTHAKIQYDASTYIGVDASVLGQQATRYLRSAMSDRLKNNFNQFLPKFGLLYKLPAGNIYATITKGYRSGGYNIQMFADILQNDVMSAVRGGGVDMSQFASGDITVEHTADNYRDIAETISYDPETSWNYEAGTHLNLFGGQLSLDFSAYYMQVRNQQIAIMAPGFSYGRMMTNAGRSYSTGLEATVHGVNFGDRLSWSLSYSFTKAKFTEYTDRQTVNGETVEVNYDGNRVPYVPQHQLAAVADYNFPIHGLWLRNVTLGANLSAQGKTYWDEANSYSQKFYAVLGAHADADFGHVKVSLWARNLTKTNYNTFAISSSATRSVEYFAQRGNPFQMGVDVRLHF